jgi:cullin 4
MKSRKNLIHQILMTEVLKQLKFPTTEKEIKTRLEKLIENDYLTRETDENNHFVYNYVA